MSILVFQHHRSEDAGSIGQTLIAHGQRLRVIRLDSNHHLPTDLDDVDGLVIMGGPQNVNDAEQHTWMQPEIDFIKNTHEAGKPIVGVCLGAQLIAAALGGTVEPMPEPEVAWHPMKLAFPGTIDPVMAGLKWNSVPFHCHGQQVTKTPPGSTPLAGSKMCRTQAYRVGLTTYAFQYHFEWDLPKLKLIAQNDPLVDKAGLSPDTIMNQCSTYYTDYRRQGDRLSKNIATLLFPVNKR